MKVTVLAKSTHNSEAGVMPTTKLLTALGEFNESRVGASAHATA